MQWRQGESQARFPITGGFPPNYHIPPPRAQSHFERQLKPAASDNVQCQQIISPYLIINSVKLGSMFIDWDCRKRGVIYFYNGFWSANCHHHSPWNLACIKAGISSNLHKSSMPIAMANFFKMEDLVFSKIDNTLAALWGPTSGNRSCLRVKTSKWRFLIGALVGGRHRSFWHVTYLVLLLSHQKYG